MSQKILVDVDGVLLDWDTAFQKWMALEGFIVKEDGDKEYKTHLRFVTNIQKDAIPEDKAEWLVKIFNRSAWIGFLEPWKDSVEVLTELNHMGWKIYGCTSMGTDQYANALRKKNIETLMPDVFAQLEIIPFMQPKGNWLAPWKGSGAVWVEDKWSNAIIGADMGIKTFLMKQSYNSKQDYQGVEKVDNWRQIYNKVIS